MELRISDYNNFAEAVPGITQIWDCIEKVLKAMPLHVKLSDQEGKSNKPVFDPKGTNSYLAGHLESCAKALAIPAEYSALGTDVDFGVGGVLIEAQFSNYPFLLNNVLRAEIFYRSGGKILVGGQPVKAAIIITKSGSFPAANSTLYYEQARQQLDLLTKEMIFNVPLRLVGLFAPLNTSFPVVETEYKGKRYSREATGSRVGQAVLTLKGDRRSLIIQPGLSGKEEVLLLQ